MRHSNHFWRGLFFILLIVALCGGLALPALNTRAAPQMQTPATNIVISEFRTRGLAGAADEFVEIYNPTAAPISIGNWQLRVITGTGTGATRATIPAGTSLAAGQYYLITNSSAQGYSGSTPADQSYATGVVDDGGVAIFDNSG